MSQNNSEDIEGVEQGTTGIADIYTGVISDTIKQLTDFFVSENIDTSILQGLRTEWILRQSQLAEALHLGCLMQENDSEALETEQRAKRMEDSQDRESIAEADSGNGDADAIDIDDIAQTHQVDGNGRQKGRPRKSRESDMDREVTTHDEEDDMESELLRLLTMPPTTGATHFHMDDVDEEDSPAVEQQLPVVEAELLDSGDDSGDEENIVAAFTAHDTMRCQNEKLLRHKGTWKFKLKQGVFTYDNQEIPFQKAVGTVKW